MSGVVYRLAMPDPHTHLLEVEVRVGRVSGAVELVMPAWTPGSYLLREFARHVQDFRGMDGAGAALPWRKTDRTTWLVEAEAGTEVVVAYRVYANEATVRTSHLDSSHCYVNGASVFMFVRGREGDGSELEVEAPEGWRVATSLRRSGSADPSSVIPAEAGNQESPNRVLDPRFRGDDEGLPADGSGQRAPLPYAPAGRTLHRFGAANYDELIDSPLEIGTHRVLAWEQCGVPHEYAIWGRGEYDADRLLADTRRVIDAARAMFGGALPYDRFVFILHLVPEGRGGLEHASSCSLQIASSKPLRGLEYESFIALVAHEFFHVWNAKRIRPEPLGPFDYTRENYTRNLWVVEGITTYYTDLLLVRAGLMTQTRYLERLAESVARLQTLPGRHHQSLEESSFDAWIRFYRPDEHTPNSQVSYYHKGSLVGLLLDMEIRRATDGARSLDDVMLLLWERYGARDVGFPEEPERGFLAAAEEVAGVPLTAFHERYVRGTAELDLATALEVVGLEMEEVPAAHGRPAADPRPASTDGGEAGADAEARRPAGPAALERAEQRNSAAADPKPAGPGTAERRLGLRLRQKDDRLAVTHVLAGGPAYAAGVNARDELVAIDGVIATEEEVTARLDRIGGDERLTLTVSRRGELLEIPVAAGTAAVRLRIREASDASPAAAAMRDDWLRAPAPDPRPADQPGLTVPNTS